MTNSGGSKGSGGARLPCESSPPVPPLELVARLHNTCSCIHSVASHLRIYTTQSIIIIYLKQFLCLSGPADGRTVCSSVERRGVRNTVERSGCCSWGRLSRTSPAPTADPIHHLRTAGLQQCPGGQKSPPQLVATKRYYLIRIYLFIMKIVHEVHSKLRPKHSSSIQ